MTKRKTADPEPERKCGQCGDKRSVMIGMAGPEPWWLCVLCYLEPFTLLEGETKPGAKSDDESDESCSVATDA